MMTDPRDHDGMICVIMMERGPHRQIGAYYDELYAARTDVWREQGHTDEFTRCIADLVEAGSRGRYLDVGCGEGFFLPAARGIEGFGVDLSRCALARARARSGATVAIGAAERFPFPDGAFDAATSVGAMEHFVDDARATAEVRRVLRRGGRYILALLVELGVRDRIQIKLEQFLWPRPHPVNFGHWLIRKAMSGPPQPSSPMFPVQPVQNQYRPRQAQVLFRRAGFRVARVITKTACPEAPLPGNYMRFYCLEAI